MRVRATEKGYYGGMIREPGDVFDLASKDDKGRWMDPIDPLDHDEDGRKGGSKPKPKAPVFDGPVDVNTADAETLAALPGLGEARAQALIAGRPWAKPDDLPNLNGVSEAMVLGWMENPGLTGFPDPVPPAPAIDPITGEAVKPDDKSGDI